MSPTLRKKHVALAAGKLSFSIIRIQSQKKTEGRPVKPITRTDS